MILEIKNASFGYGKNVILDNISLTAEKGDLIAILGPNGAGKTTLIRCMLGFLKWTKGKSLLGNENINSISAKKLWSKVSYVPQAKNFTSGATVLETVLLGRTSSLSLFSQPKQKDIDICMQKLEKMGISHLSEKRCSEISGGELQMVLICRAIVSDPEIVVLDEPESNLDFKNQLIVLNTLSELSKSGVTCIFNTHYPEHALRLSNKALLLKKRDGYIFGETSKVVTEENIEKAFGVKAVIASVETEESTLRSITALRLSDSDERPVSPDEERLAIISIIASDYSKGELINEYLHSAGKYLIGRMGMPYRKDKVNIINVTLKAPYSEIESLVTRLCTLDGVSVKATYAKKEGSF